MKTETSWTFMGAVDFPSTGQTEVYWMREMEGYRQIERSLHSPDTGLLDRGHAEQEIAFLIYTLQREGIQVAQHTMEPMR
jgi:hypothetical protein